ncbi:MAG: hypothetical protein WD749_07005 [Phycisphaerales bacterium]
MSQAMSAVPPVPPPEQGAAAYSFGEAFSLGWRAFTANYGPLLLVSFVGMVISIGVSLAQNLIDRAIGVPGLLSLPISLLFSAQLTAGMMYAGVRAARGERVGLEHLFRGFSGARPYWPLAGVQGLVMLVMLVCMLPGLLVLAVSIGAGAGPGAAVAALLLCMLPAMYFSSRFFMSAMVAVDERGGLPGPIEAMRASWGMTGELRWLSLIGLGLVLGLIALASALALLLPLLFFAMPLIVAVWGAAYVLLAGESGAVGAGAAGAAWADAVLPVVRGADGAVMRGRGSRGG